MIKRLLLIIALALSALPAFAQQPVEITSDLFTVDETTRNAVFTGNVVVIHPTVKVWADKVVAIYGEGGTSDIESFVATGSVRLVTDEQDATGDRAVFTPADQMLRLTGNVNVVNSGGTVAAGELVVNLETNVSTFTSSGSGGRVTGVFTSQ
ncbi:lipopolysaccharide export system protein LptA [Devosia sp. YR412]|uniref:lipopolysaccharide transport periplasmic protein LptA n=1 Tax=Devosia sp. YR412 TaxID=1881030 RepID=UPI0008D355EA|nr:lipopolysaccharide transport periplasmic protein LptA [Devosia sp. YR412]SEP62958.1 lipopolysaccharide export system protein LptA [Devosia sp. YR412]